jgi:hypothetical protein
MRKARFLPVLLALAILIPETGAFGNIEQAAPFKASVNNRETSNPLMPALDPPIIIEQGSSDEALPNSGIFAFATSSGSFPELPFPRLSAQTWGGGVPA